MRIAKFDDILLADSAKQAVNATSGVSVPVTASERERLKQLSRESLILQATDIELMGKGLAGPLTVVQEARAALRAEIQNQWNTTSTITIMPTEKCDLRCTYCYETFARGKMSAQLIPGVLKLLDDQIARRDVVHLAWFGGEPTLASDIVGSISKHFVAALSDSGKLGSISITTNGRRLDQEMERIIKLGLIDVFQITLDGPKSVHDRRRKMLNGRGTYDAIMANIAFILAESPARVTIRVNLDVSNDDDIVALCEWVRSELNPIKDEHGERVSIAFVPTWQADSQGIEGICLNDLRSVERLLRVSDVRREVEGRSRADQLVALTSQLGSLSCYAGKQGSYVVGSDGTLYKCSVAFGREDNHVGKILQDGSYQIEAHKERLWTSQSALTDENCNGCAFNRSCQGIFCPLTRIQTGQTPCPTEKRFVAKYLTEELFDA